MNKAKSLSPKLALLPVTPRITLQKLAHSPKVPSHHLNDSIYSNSSQISHGSQDNQLQNRLFYGRPSSSSTSSLKLSSPRSTNILVTPTQQRVQTLTKRVRTKQKNSPKSALSEHMLPMPADQVISTFNAVLTKFEISELLNYKDVYYLGLKAEKVVPAVKLSNFGFDNEKTDYRLVVGDHIAFQYEINELLGSSNLAQVCRCWDHKSKKEIALKIIKANKVVQEQNQEIKMLSYIKKHEKTTRSMFVQMIEHFMFRGHLCIVFELLSFTLYDLLKVNQFKGFSTTLVRRFTHQIVLALNYLKANRIIHCDLKPENIILTSPNESNIKIINFGMSCFEGEKSLGCVQSLAYRAPEVLLGLSYSAAIDMWSLGCIIFELLAGVALFQGENEVDQIYAIIEVIGQPPSSLLKSSAKRYKLFGSEGISSSFRNSRGVIRFSNARTLESQLPSADLFLLDFIKRNFHTGCLEWSPDHRLTPLEAISHPWLHSFHKLKPQKPQKPQKPSRLKQL